ncbi:MAG: hypothetical protein KatS3mg060_2748 [Dehalococcoidia bacterium]|nr:MAG: hypothetical protein KatS3mg060_2748 [Dehalococcoidia bacterium]
MACPYGSSEEDESGSTERDHPPHRCAARPGVGRAASADPSGGLDGAADFPRRASDCRWFAASSAGAWGGAGGGWRRLPAFLSVGRSTASCRGRRGSGRCARGLLKCCFAWRALDEAAARVEHCLASGDLSTARAALRSLVSRDTRSLDAGQAAAAAIESLAENYSDSLVAPALAYAAAGLGGAFAYRWLNTADAMIGYRGRYEWAGKPAARLDDAANLVPARLAAGLLIAAGGDRRRAVEVLRRDRRPHREPECRLADGGDGRPDRPVAGEAGALPVETPLRRHPTPSTSRKRGKSSGERGCCCSAASRLHCWWPADEISASRTVLDRGCAARLGRRKRGARTP